MPAPPPAGKVYYDDPRAVFVRDPESTEGKHSAVRSAINVYVDSKLEADFIMSHWRDFMNTLSGNIEAMLNNNPDSPRNKGNGDGKP